MEPRLRRVIALNDLLPVLDATYSCIRDKHDLIEQSLRHSGTRWYANDSGYVRFVAADFLRDGQPHAAWLLDLSYCAFWHLQIHPCPAAYALAASDVLREEFPPHPHYIFAQRLLAAIFRASIWTSEGSEQQRRVVLYQLPVHAPLCKHALVSSSRERPPSLFYDLRRLG